MFFSPGPSIRANRNGKSAEALRGNTKTKEAGDATTPQVFSELVLPQHLSRSCVGARSPRWGREDLKDMGGVVLHFPGSQRSSAQHSLLTLLKLKVKQQVLGQKAIRTNHNTQELRAGGASPGGKHCHGAADVP